METFLTKRQAGDLLGITERELHRRIQQGECQAREFPSQRNHGKTVMKIILESLPAEMQQAWFAEKPGLGVRDSGLGDRLPPAQQMPLPLRNGEAFRYLDNTTGLKDYVEKWFGILTSTDVLHWNGDWKWKFRNQPVKYLAVPGEAAPRAFPIDSKTAVIEWIAASSGLSVSKVYQRRREMLAFLNYATRCVQSGREPDGAEAEKFFPAFNGQTGKGLRPRADRGVSKTISPKQEGLIADMRSSGTVPGGPGKKGSGSLIVYTLNRLREQTAAEGEDPDAMGMREVSASAVRRYLKSHPPDRADLLAKHGSKWWHDHVEPYIHRTYEGMFVHDWWISDHRQINVNLKWWRDPRVVYRPWGTWWMDVRSRYPLALVIDFTPSSRTILSSFGNAVLAFETLPLAVYCDNGKDYLAQVLCGIEGFTARMDANDGFDHAQQGLFKDLGIQMRRALPSSRSKRTGEQQSHARSKGVIESFFGNWLDDFDLTQPGACGGNPFEKPDKLPVELADPENLLITDLEYEQRLTTYLLERYVQRHHHTGEGMHGKTPREAFECFARPAAGLESRRQPREILSAKLCTGAVQRKVRNSYVIVTIAGREYRYFHPRFPDLWGQEMDVVYDPTNPDYVYVSWRGEFLGAAQRVEDLSYGADAEKIGEQMALQRRTYRSAVELLHARTIQPVEAQAPATAQGPHPGATLALPASTVASARPPRRQRPAVEAVDNPTSEEVAERMMAAMEGSGK